MRDLALAVLFLLSQVHVEAELLIEVPPIEKRVIQAPPSSPT